MRTYAFLIRLKRDGEWCEAAADGIWWNPGASFRNESGEHRYPLKLIQQTLNKPGGTAQVIMRPVSGRFFYQQEKIDYETNVKRH